MPDETHGRTSEEDQFSEGLTQMAGLLLNEQTLDAVMDLVARLASTSIPGTRAVSVSLLRNEKVETVAHSDELARAVDGDQYATGEGPCVEAIRTGAVMQIEQMSDEQRWPSFTPRACDKGVASALSMPLAARKTTIGALNIYSLEPRNFTDKVTLASDFSERASTVLSNAQTYAEAQELSDQLREALRTRELIGQAVGITMAREGVDADEAFQMLRKVSQDRNIKMRAVAEQLVANVGSKRS